MEGCLQSAARSPPCAAVVFMVICMNLRMEICMMWLLLGGFGERWIGSEDLK